MVQLDITTFVLSEKDVKKIIADYFKRNLKEVVNNDDIDISCGIKYSGPVNDRHEEAYLKNIHVDVRH